MRFPFPKDFMFGAACSACQIEAGCHEGGKGEDVGEHFFQVFPEKYFGADPNRSADFYHKYPQDIQMMKELGLQTFRFSISWSRVFPDGPDRLEQRGLARKGRVRVLGIREEAALLSLINREMLLQPPATFLLNWQPWPAR